MSKIDVRKITSPDGAIRYIKDGKLHNSDGPAVVYPDGKEEYYINGFQFTKDEFQAFFDVIKAAAPIIGTVIGKAFSIIGDIASVVLNIVLFLVSITPIKTSKT